MHIYINGPKAEQGRKVYFGKGQMSEDQEFASRLVPWWMWKKIEG